MEIEKEWGCIMRYTDRVKILGIAITGSGDTLSEKESIKESVYRLENAIRRMKKEKSEKGESE